MKQSAKYARHLKKHSVPVLQFNPYLLSAKSSYRLLFKRNTEEPINSLLKHAIIERSCEGKS
jgi:hypothetical protein